MILQRIFVWSLGMLAVAAISLLGAGVPEIEGRVETEFGIYEPVGTDIAPALGDITVAEDFSNVIEFDNLSRTLDERMLELLAANHFVAAPGRFKQIHDLYNWVAKEDLPQFVTTDGMLHTYHIIYDYALRILETNYFREDLLGFNRELLESLRLRASSDEKLDEELRLCVAFAAVATKLGDPGFGVPEEVSDLVDAELALMEAHQGGVESPVLGYREDYSQYVPRGHYTRSEELENYFMSMMWYGRMGFRLRPGETEELIEKGRSETRMALNIVAALEGLEVAGEPAFDVWERIYQPTVFFVGAADDLTWKEYAELAAEVYGKRAGLLTPEEIADPQKLETFIDRAMELRPSRINSDLVVSVDPEDLKRTRGFRVMGQRYIPDSYVLWELVFPNVTDRMMPRGLDPMAAVLGSGEAEDLLYGLYDEDREPTYVEQLEKLKGEFSALPPDTWAQNLYWNWLYCLAPFFEPKGEGWPYFMRSDAWRRKELGTALGSWAELRHDTILYAKQSYTFETSLPPPPDNLPGYVEPEPGVFARLAALARYMRAGLESRGLLDQEIGWRLIKFENLALGYKLIAEKELRGELTTDEEDDLIRSYGKSLERLVTFPSEAGGQQIENDTDDEMAVIADVHTDPNSGSVLEVGVGYPLVLYVIVPTRSGPLMTVGGMFSYYEFKHPMSDRLTDEAWQQWLERDDRPQPAEWLDAFLAGEAVTDHTSQPSRDTTVDPVIEIPAHRIMQGDSLMLRAMNVGDAQEVTVRFSHDGEFISEERMELDRNGFYSVVVSTTGWPAGNVTAEVLRDGKGAGSTYFELGRAAGSGCDLDGNGRTDVSDLIELLRRLSRRESPDLNNDGKGDIFDLIEMLRSIGTGDAPENGPVARLTALGGCSGDGTRSLKGSALELTPEGGGVVSLVHTGASYNCCLDSITVSVASIRGMGPTGGVIRLTETEHVENLCRCTCDYTVYAEITGLSPGNYTVEVVRSTEPDTVIVRNTVTVP